VIDLHSDERESSGLYTAYPLALDVPLVGVAGPESACWFAPVTRRSTISSTRTWTAKGPSYTQVRDAVRNLKSACVATR